MLNRSKKKTQLYNFVRFSHLFFQRKNMLPRVKRWRARQQWKTKMPLSNHSKKRTISRMPYFWGLRLWSQSSQNDHNPHKNTLFFKTAHSLHKMISALFPRIAIIITILIKYTIYKDCDHDHSPHINISCFWVFIWLRLWSQSFLFDCDHDCNITKISYLWVFMRTTIF